MFIDSDTPIEVLHLKTHDFITFDANEHLEQIKLNTQLIVYDLSLVKILNCMQINQLILTKE